MAGILALLTGLIVSSTRAEQTATVKKDRVNVRGQATLKSEVITQLKKGETVVVLEEIDVAKPKRGQPAKWARIQLPPNTPVWVYAPYIELTNKTVNIRRLNIRGGPGENYSVLGRIERGASVKEIRTDGNWMEIEPPPNTSAFVAADLLDISAPAPTPEPIIAATPTNAPPPATTETVTTEPAPAVAVDTTAQPPAQPVAAAPQPATQPAPVVRDEPPPRRVISREGKVIVSRSIQAPTEYALESAETKRTINYLHTEELGLKLKNFGGRKVIVTGEELIDQRWTNTPIIEVESIRLLP